MQFVTDLTGSLVWAHSTLALIGVASSIVMGIGMWWFAVRYRAHVSSVRLRESRKPDFFSWTWAVALLAGIVTLCGILAASDPQRKVLVPDVEYTGACIGISVDASFSMLAPERRGAKQTRLGRALAEIKSLAESFPSGDRLNLMAFAGTPEIFSSQWTSDRTLFFTRLHYINESYVSVHGRSGSDIPAAIGKWFSVLPEKDSCTVVIVIFTDGEPEGDENELAKQLVSSLELFSGLKRRVITFLVAVGDDTEPLRIPEYDHAGHFQGFAVKDDGSYIFSRPDIWYLKDIAARFLGKLIFTEKHDENLQQKISSSITEARKIAAISSKVTYRSIAAWFAVGFVVSLALLLGSIIRL